MTTHRLLCLLLATICLFAPRAGVANETPVAGIGGTYRPMRGESRVRLVREFLDIRFSPRLARTTVQFEFRNEGPAQTVAMGFPEQVLYDRASYRHFRVTVDGHPIAAKPTRWKELDYRTRWERWWVSRLYFARGERHVVRVQYQERPAMDSYGEGYTYVYVFSTGRAWKGPIGQVEGRVTLEGFPEEAHVWTDGPQVVRKGNTLTWRFRDWDPKDDDDLGMIVCPHIIDVYLNGELMDPPIYLDLYQDHLSGDMNEVEGVVIGLDEPEQLSWSPRKKTATLRVRDRTVLLTVGSREATVLPEPRTVRLPFAPYLQGGNLHVPVRAVCEALGWTIHAAKNALGNWEVRIADPKARKEDRKGL